MAARRKNGCISPGSLCEQAALMLAAGIPLADGLRGMAGDGEESLRTAAVRAEKTGLLSEALRGEWPGYMVEMIAIGEHTGRLEQVLKGLSAYYAREERLRRMLSGAAAYPMALGSMLLLIVLVMLWKVFPVFRRVLASLGVGMTGAAGRMMSMGTAVGWLVLALVSAALLTAGACMLLMRTGARKKVLGVLTARIGALRRLRRRTALARLASALSMLLGAGVGMDGALELTAGVVEDEETAAGVEKLRAALSEGAAFADAVSDAGLFSALHCRMIRLGAAAGREDEVLAGIAAEMEGQAERSADRLAAAIEPALVALLTVVIGAVLLSVMLPMAGILSSML